jgi:hypothetical protein
MSENSSEGIRKEPSSMHIDQATMKQQSNPKNNRHERSLSQTITPDNAGDADEQTRKNRSSIDVGEW